MLEILKSILDLGSKPVDILDWSDYYLVVLATVVLLSPILVLVWIKEKLQTKWKNSNS